MGVCYGGNAWHVVGAPANFHGQLWSGSRAKDACFACSVQAMIPAGDR